MSVNYLFLPDELERLAVNSKMLKVHRLGIITIDTTCSHNCQHTKSID